MGKLILNQTQIPREQWRYGLRSSAKTGCGWIALYNALILLGKDPEPETLIRALERQLPLIHGNAGTFCLGPALLLKKYGYRVNICSDTQRFDTLVQTSDAAILYYYWRDGLRVGAHFIALKWDGTQFVGYNTFTNSTAPDGFGQSLSGYLRRQGFFGCVLTVLRKNLP